MTMVLSDCPAPTRDKLTADEIQECDQIALYYLQLEDKELKGKKVLHNLESVYYKEKGDEGALIVCRDGSILFANYLMVPFGKHKLAFEDGLRSSKVNLEKRKYAI